MSRERPMVVIDEPETFREEATRHGRIGIVTAYRIRDSILLR